VLDDFEPIGWAYREIDEHVADRATIIRALMSGEYNDPVRIVAFNTAESWARDVTTDIAREIRGRSDKLSPGQGSNAETRNIARCVALAI
jgi:hypothetical protein